MEPALIMQAYLPALRITSWKIELGRFKYCLHSPGQGCICAIILEAAEKSTKFNFLSNKGF